MSELDFEAVRERWFRAGGKDTGGIIDWFGPPVVERWTLREISATEVGRLRFIGAEGGGRWGEVTGGSNRVEDLQAQCGESGFRWNEEWVLVAIRDPESRERGLID